MEIRKDSFSDVILDEELIHDYEFGVRLYNLLITEDLREYSLKRSLVYMGYF